MSSAHPLIAQFARAGQAQVFAFFNELAPDAQARLLAEAGEIDLAEVERLFRSLVAGGGAIAFPVTDWAQETLYGLQYVPVGGGQKKFARGTQSGEGWFRVGNGGDVTVVTEAVIDEFANDLAAANQEPGTRNP